MAATWREKYPLKCFVVRKSLPILMGLSTLFMLLGLVLFAVLILDRHYFNLSFDIDTQLAALFGQFFQGLIGTIFAIAGAMLIALTFLYQNLTNKKAQVERLFVKMLEFHRDNVSNIRIKSYKDFAKTTAERIEGARAFVLFKLQLFDILRLVQDLNVSQSFQLSSEKEVNLAYMIFFYGIDKEWESFTNSNLSEYGTVVLEKIEQERARILKETGKNIGRTNQTVLSSYYRNMYNAIKLVDESIYLTRKEKYDYKLIKNIPAGYLQNYDHKKSFDMEYEDDELRLQ